MTIERQSSSLCQILSHFCPSISTKSFSKDFQFAGDSNHLQLNNSGPGRKLSLDQSFSIFCTRKKDFTLPA